MRQISLQIPENSSPVSEAQRLVQAIGTALARDFGSLNTKDAITLAKRRLGFSIRRTERLWYADSKRIYAEEMDRLREIAAALDKERAVAAVVAFRRQLVDRDQGGNQEAIDALDRALGHLGKENRGD